MNDAPVVLAVVLLASDDPITWLTPLLVVYELVAGAVIGGCSAGRARGRCAGPRCPRPASTRWPPSRSACSPTPPASSRTPPGCSPPTSPRWCSATPTCRTAAACARSPRAPAGWPRSGCSCCSGCTPRRPGWSTRWSRRWSRGWCWWWRRGRCRCSPRRAPFRVPWREQAFLSWSGLRGAVPIVLALIALTEGAPAAQALVDVVFVLVVVLTLLQGTTLPWVARLLGVAESRRPRRWRWTPPRSTSWAPTCCRCGCRVGSRLRGVYLRELRLPRGATVSLVVRDEEAFTPTGRPGCASATSSSSSPRPRRAGRPRSGSGPSTGAGRLARWHGESGQLRDDGPRERRPTPPGRTPCRQLATPASGCSP